MGLLPHAFNQQMADEHTIRQFDGLLSLGEAYCTQSCENVTIATYTVASQGYVIYGMCMTRTNLSETPG